ncbi:hypothetical protein RND81_12G219800 [Saponaria officinalis]|uniref:Uncharacterized protein n=1 Tax=Saponaria officinalis TaxID=3572 RepID=A0AAW1HDV2_SAPOF
MDSSMLHHNLPPMKRFTLLHHQTRLPKPDSNPIPSSHLPAKKRKLSENLPPTAYSLPAKKRVWAIPPDSNPLSNIDLNVEYVPSPEKKKCPPDLVSGLPAKKRVWAVRPDSPSPEKKKSPPNSPRRLPAKKRVLAVRSDSPSPETEKFPPNTPHCLPAKKRVWAVQPESPSPEKRNFPPNSTCLLPAKKRVLAVRPESPSPEKKKSLPNSPCCLPAKKRVWEARPESPSPKKEEEEDDDDEEENDGIMCAVCSSTDGDPKDPIVFCDGCELMVHANCYGNPLTESIPEGDWLCKKCEHDKNDVFNCCLCPVTGGALKPTNDGRWAHIGCAVLVPEVFFEDSEGRDGIDCSLVPNRRWKGRCYLCGSRNGCVVECSEPRCTMSFHVGCGLNEDLCIQLIERRTKTTRKSNCGGIVAAFCRKHTDIWDKQQQTGKFKIVARDEE